MNLRFLVVGAVFGANPCLKDTYPYVRARLRFYTYVHFKISGGFCWCFGANSSVKETYTYELKRRTHMYKRHVHMCMKETYVFVKESCTCLWCIGTGFSVLCHNESCLVLIWIDEFIWNNELMWDDDLIWNNDLMWIDVLIMNNNLIWSDASFDTEQ